MIDVNELEKYSNKTIYYKNNKTDNCYVLGKYNANENGVKHEDLHGQGKTYYTPLPYFNNGSTEIYLNDISENVEYYYFLPIHNPKSYFGGNKTKLRKSSKKSKKSQRRRKTRRSRK